MAFDLYQHVTATIIASLETGAPAWRKPWTDDTAAFPPRASGEPGRGIIFLSDQLVRASELSRRAPVRPVIEGSCWRWHLARQHAPSPKEASRATRSSKVRGREDFIVTASSDQTRKRPKRTPIPWRTLGAGEVALAPDVAHQLAHRFGVSDVVMEYICRHLDRMLRDDWLEFHDYERHIIRSQSPGQEAFQTAREEQAAQIFAASGDHLQKQADALARIHQDLQSLALESPYHQVFDFPPFEELKERLKAIQAELDGLPKRLTRLRKAGAEEGVWRVSPKSRRGKERDPRRVYLVAVMFNCTRFADEELTYSTDAVTNERRGPFVDFFNAILQEVTDPPTTISGNTIIADLRRRRQRGSRQ